PSEIIELRPHHIDIQNKVIAVPRTFNARQRSLPIHEEQIIVLQHYLTTVRKKLLLIADKQQDHLFVNLSTSQKNRYITDNLLSTLKKRHPQIVSYTHLRASVLAHWYSLYGLKKTIELSGHYYIATSARKK
ncbi:MAG: tyrosine-type recombinase/integrase, partial [Bacteroidota bacterium]